MSSTFVVSRFASAHDGITSQIAGLTIAIVADPGNAALLLRRAELYRVVSQWQRALADLDRVRVLDPTLAAADFARAQVLLGAAQPLAAVEAASRFLTKQPRHPDALVVRARARLAAGHVHAAIEDFTQALEIRPSPDLYVERARVVPTSSAAEIEAVLRGLDAGIERLGSLVTLELEAIDLERRLKRYDAALTRLDRVSVLASRKDPWLARRGEILEEAGRTEEARMAYRAALTAATSLPPARQTRASSALVARLRTHLERLGVEAGPPRERN